MKNTKLTVEPVTTAPEFRITLADVAEFTITVENQLDEKTPEEALTELFCEIVRGGEG